MDVKSTVVMRSLIKKYYEKISGISPKKVEEREFGFGDFERKIAYRHVSFKNSVELQNYLKENAPPHISYSSAYYRLPAARPMESKKFLGAELVFDLDASDLHLSCQKEHGTDWVCENCLSAVKSETIRLIEEFLIPDFGFSKKEMSVNFSGNRGYHVHVYNEDILNLKAEERREISAYISATGLEPTSIFPTLGIRGIPLKGPKPTDKGWAGRFARSFISSLNSGVSYLTELGIEKRTANKLIKKRAEVVLGITTGNWDKINVRKKAEFWTNTVKKIVINQSDSIDRNVTNDPYHLIRLENSVHGGSGLIAKKFSLSELESFEPMKDAIAFGNEPIKVSVKSSPKFMIGGEEYGPYSNITLELPAYAAGYLILKDKASVIS